jgi:hypothetical protein
MIIGQLIDHGEHLKQVLRSVVVTMRLAVAQDQLLAELGLPRQRGIPACQ